MDDFTSLEKNIIRELSCRLCLCTDVMKLKPLNAEMKRKMKKLFGIVVRNDDSLPKAICHDCTQQLTNMHLYSVKVEKTQKFLEFRTMKAIKEKKESEPPERPHPIVNSSGPKFEQTNSDHTDTTNSIKSKKPPIEHQQGDVKDTKTTPDSPKKKSFTAMRFMEDMPMEEFLKTEKVDKSLLKATLSNVKKNSEPKKAAEKEKEEKEQKNMDNQVLSNESLDPIVLIEGRPAKEGTALDRQITLFYKMECCICHDTGFHFRSLMKHYKDKHGVPGYVTCCDKKFHYFHPKRIIEHMAYHLQPNIFMCGSCHQNFQSSQELQEHQSNGGRSEGKITCPKCSERYPTYRELGCHIISHRTDKLQCDYCSKLLKHHHRKKTVNHMEDLILCSQCVRTLKNIEKQEKELKEQMKASGNLGRNSKAYRKQQKFRQAMGLSPDEETSTD